jgi:hypothetical protein
MFRDLQLDEYLKGALAGKFIDRVGREVECQELFSATDSDDVLRLSAPDRLPVNSRLDLCVRILNVLQRQTEGTLLLRGEEASRGVTYEFEAPVKLDPDRAGCCIAFHWKSPSYATRVKWSATVQLENQFGHSLPVCSGTTVVTEAGD